MEQLQQRVHNLQEWETDLNPAHPPERNPPPRSLKCWWHHQWHKRINQWQHFVYVSAHANLQRQNTELLCDRCHVRRSDMGAVVMRTRQRGQVNKQQVSVMNEQMKWWGNAVSKWTKERGNAGMSAWRERRTSAPRMKEERHQGSAMKMKMENECTENERGTTPRERNENEMKKWTMTKWKLNEKINNDNIGTRHSESLTLVECTCITVSLCQAQKRQWKWVRRTQGHESQHKKCTRVLRHTMMTTTTVLRPCG